MNIREISVSSLQKKILETSHTFECSDVCREYFKRKGLLISNLKRTDFKSLIDFIRKEINILCSNNTYSMIEKLSIKSTVHFAKDSINLRISGSYFKSREGITFNRNGFISFCSEMSGCNRIPFHVGFMKWVDFLKGSL